MKKKIFVMMLIVLLVFGTSLVYAEKIVLDTEPTAYISFDYGTKNSSKIELYASGARKNLYQVLSGTNIHLETGYGNTVNLDDTDLPDILDKFSQNPNQTSVEVNGKTYREVIYVYHDDGNYDYYIYNNGISYPYKIGTYSHYPVQLNDWEGPYYKAYFYHDHDKYKELVEKGDVAKFESTGKLGYLCDEQTESGTWYNHIDIEQLKKLLDKMDLMDGIQEDGYYVDLPLTLAIGYLDDDWENEYVLEVPLVSRNDSNFEALTGFKFNFSKAYEYTEGGWFTKLEEGLSGIIRGFANFLYNIVLAGIQATGGSTTNLVTIDDLVFDTFPDTSLYGFYDESGSTSSLVSKFKDGVKTWFDKFTALTVLIYVILLLYVGIRILMAVGGRQQEKYKEMLASWLQGLALLVFFPIAIKYAIQLNHGFVEMIDKSKFEAIEALDSSYGEMESEVSFEYPTALTAEEGAEYGNAITSNPFKGHENDSYMGFMACKAEEKKKLVDAVVYLIMVIQFILLLIAYYKRLMMFAFLVAIFPVVMIMYPIDKSGDGRAQSFSTWSTELMTNIFLQVFHAIVYVFVIGVVYSAGDVSESWLLSIVGITFLFKGEELIRTILSPGETETAPTLKQNAGKSIAAIAITSTIADNLTDNVGHFARSYRDFRRARTERHYANALRSGNGGTGAGLPSGGNTGANPSVGEGGEVSVTIPRGNNRSGAVNTPLGKSGYTKEQVLESVEALKTMDGTRNPKDIAEHLRVLQGAVASNSPEVDKLLKGSGLSAKQIEDLTKLQLGAMQATLTSDKSKGNYSKNLETINKQLEIEITKIFPNMSVRDKKMIKQALLRNASDRSQVSLGRTNNPAFATFQNRFLNQGKESAEDTDGRGKKANGIMGEVRRKKLAADGFINVGAVIEASNNGTQFFAHSSKPVKLSGYASRQKEMLLAEMSKKVYLNAAGQRITAKEAKTIQRAGGVVTTRVGRYYEQTKDLSASTKEEFATSFAMMKEFSVNARETAPQVIVGRENGRREAVAGRIDVSSEAATRIASARASASRAVTGGAESARPVTGGTEPTRTVTSGAEPTRAVTGGTEPARIVTGGAEPPRTVTGGTEPARTVSGGTESRRTASGGVPSEVLERRTTGEVAPSGAESIARVKTRSVAEYELAREATPIGPSLPPRAGESTPESSPRIDLSDFEAVGAYSTTTYNLEQLNDSVTFLASLDDNPVASGLASIVQEEFGVSGKDTEVLFDEVVGATMTKTEPGEKRQFRKVISKHVKKVEKDSSIKSAAKSSIDLDRIREQLEDNGVYDYEEKERVIDSEEEVYAKIMTRVATRDRDHLIRSARATNPKKDKKAPSQPEAIEVHTPRNVNPISSDEGTRAPVRDSDPNPNPISEPDRVDTSTPRSSRSARESFDRLAEESRESMAEEPEEVFEYYDDSTAETSISQLLYNERENIGPQEYVIRMSNERKDMNSTVLEDLINGSMVEDKAYIDPAPTIDGRTLEEHEALAEKYRNKAWENVLRGAGTTAAATTGVVIGAPLGIGIGAEDSMLKEALVGAASVAGAADRVAETAFGPKSVKKIKVRNPYDGSIEEVTLERTGFDASEFGVIKESAIDTMSESKIYEFKDLEKFMSKSMRLNVQAKLSDSARTKRRKIAEDEAKRRAEVYKDNLLSKKKPKK